MENKEYSFRGMCANGFGLLAVQCVLNPALIAVVNILFLDVLAITIPLSVILGVLWCILWGGFFVQQPNQSRVMIFFGEYRGTFHKTGFYWCNPFMSRKKNVIAHPQYGHRAYQGQ